MGLLQKAATFKVLKVAGSVPSLGEVKSILSGLPHKDINGTSDKEAFSVCHVEDVFKAGAVEQSESTLAFGVRHDKKTISRPMFKKRYKEEMLKLRKERKGTKLKITKDDRQLIKENVEGELYSQAKVVEKLIEVLWDTKDQTLYVGVTSDKIIDSIIHVLITAFQSLELKSWNPLDIKTKHEDVETSRNNFWNAFFTWIFYETRKKDKDKPIWVPGNITFSKNDNSVTIKGDTDISMEVWTAVLTSKLVESLDLGYEVDKEHKYEVNLKEGSWAFRGLKITPDIRHENLETAIFERVESYKQFIAKFTQLVRQYESIRNDEKQDNGFWESLSSLSSSKIRNEIGGMV